MRLSPYLPTWETPDLGGFQASWKPVLWLEAFPTASEIPGNRSATMRHKFASESNIMGVFCYTEA